MPIASYCVDTGPYVAPTVTNNRTECLSGLVRYNDVTNNALEQNLWQTWWAEQINQFGMKVNYYVNKYSLSAHDYFYGEQPLAGFAAPIAMIFAVTLSNDSVILSKFGLQGTADLTALIAISTFTNTLTSSSLSGITNIYQYEPKAGDLIELSEYGQTRPNGRSGQIYEITERVDQKGGTANQLLGHYVWMIQAKRFDYSYEPQAPREAKMDQVYDNKSDGYLNNLPKILETKTYTQFVDKDSEQVFDYATNPQSNTNVYGDYEDTNILVNLIGVTNTTGQTVGALGASASNTYVVVQSPSNYSTSTGVTITSANAVALQSLYTLLSSYNPALSSLTPIMPNIENIATSIQGPNFPTLTNLSDLISALGSIPLSG